MTYIFCGCNPKTLVSVSTIFPFKVLNFIEDKTQKTLFFLNEFILTLVSLFSNEKKDTEVRRNFFTKLKVKFQLIWLRFFLDNTQSIKVFYGTYC